MKRITWICSIYPSSKNLFNGDFIERHAKAASLYNDITVIYVFTGVKNEHVSKEYNTRLRAEIISIPMNSLGWQWLQQIIIFRKYIAAFRLNASKRGRPDLLHVNYVRSAGVMATWFNFFYSIPYVITEHWSGYLFETPNLIDRLCFIKARKIAAVSNYLRSHLKKLFPSKEIEVIPNVVDRIFFNSEDIKEGPFIFLHNSGEENIKRSMVVVKAFAELLANKKQESLSANMQLKNIPAKVELHLYGEYREDIELYIESHQLRQVVFQHGLIMQEDLAYALSKASCLVQYSAFETFGCIVAESLCCGVPVIVSDIPAMRELVQKDINGMLVASDNFHELSNAMHEMICSRLQFNSQKIADAAQKQFSFERVGRMIEEFYQSAL